MEICTDTVVSLARAFFLACSVLNCDSWKTNINRTLFSIALSNVYTKTNTKKKIHKAEELEKPDSQGSSGQDAVTEEKLPSVHGVPWRHLLGRDPGIGV